VIIKLSFHDNKATKLWNIILQYIEQSFLQFGCFFSVCLMSDLFVKIIRTRIVSIQGRYKDGFMWKLWNWVERCEFIQSSAWNRYLVDVDFGYGFTGKRLEKFFRFYFNRFSWLGKFLDSFQRVNDDNDTHSAFTT